MKVQHTLFTGLAMVAVLFFTACPPTPQQPVGGGDSTATDTTTQPAGHDYGAAVITLERSTCFGTCPSYTLRIDGSGKVDYNGRDFVAVKGAQTGQITADAFKELVDAFFAMDYFSLQDSFDTNIEDVPHCISSIDVDGRHKRIFNRYGGPQNLRDLEGKVDKAANVAQWVESADR